MSKLRLRYEVTGGISKEYWCEMKDLGSPAEIKELLRTIRSFAEQTLENLVVRFGDVPLVLAHQILSPRWSFKQPDLVESAKALAAFWKVDEQALVSQLRAAFAIRGLLNLRGQRSQDREIQGGVASSFVPHDQQRLRRRGT